jgi:hypothetical protein
MRDPTDLTGIADDDEAQRLADERKRQQDAEDIKWLMGHRPGRRLVWQWLSDAGVYRNPFNHSGSVTAFNCGAQNLGQQLMARIMDHAPDAYVAMLKEHKPND